MRRPSYIVVSLTVTLLAIFGTLTRLAQPYLQPNTPNRLAAEASAFLRQAETSPIDWYPLEQEPFTLAKRAGRPIMLVIGSPGSEVGRRMDREVFSDTDVQAYLQRNMISVRIDALQRPEFLGAFLPLSRAETGMLPDLQVWFLQPDGRVFAHAGGIGTTQDVNPQVFLETLLRASQRFDDLSRQELTASASGDGHRLEVQTISAPAAGGLPDFFIQDEVLTRLLNPRYGGFPLYERISTDASVYRYLLQRGRTEDFKRAMDPLLRGPLVDWIDGGFFSMTRSRPRAAVDFDKIAVQNAELMHVLAMASRVQQEPLYSEIAMRTFASLTGEFMDGGFVAAVRIGDEGVRNRSARSSFSPRRLSEALTPRERRWAEDLLGLRYDRNPIMTIRPPDPAEVFRQWDGFMLIRRKLLEGQTDTRRFAGERYLDVNGFVAARLSQTARIMGDESALRSAAGLYDRLRLFRAGDDVRRTLNRDEPLQPYLGDYLAYADASLQDFLATGRVESLESGLAVLVRARFLFESETPGVFRLVAGPENPLWGPRDIGGPELLDYLRESCTAQVIRLFNAYGRLLRNPGKADPADNATSAQSLIQTAATTAGQFSRFSESLALVGSGYFAATLGLLDDAHAVVVGPNAVGIAQELFQRVPTRLVAPALGPVRPDLQRRSPGIYMIRRDEIRGPLSLEDAAAMLPRRLTPL